MKKLVNKLITGIKGLSFKDANDSFGLILIYMVTLPFFGSIREVITAIFIGVNCFRSNNKGFTKTRSIRRYFFYFVGITVLLFLCYYATSSFYLLILLSFFITFFVVFFGMEEYIPGLRDYFPMMYVFALYIGRVESLSEIYPMIGQVFVSLFIATAYGLFFKYSRPLDRMKEKINIYVNEIMDEVQLYSKENVSKKTIERAVERTRDMYNECLREYYKLGEGIYLVSVQSKEILSLLSKLHFMIEDIREIHQTYNEEENKKLLELGYYFSLLQLSDSDIDVAEFKHIDKEEMDFYLQTYNLKKKIFLAPKTKETKRSKLRRLFFLYRKEDFIYWFKANCDKNSILLRYAIRLAIIMTLSVGTAYFFDMYTTNVLHLESELGQWIPLTALIVSQPYFEDTAKKIVIRILGTIVGILVTSFLFYEIGNNDFSVYIIIFALQYLIFLLLKAHYFLAVIVITMSSMIMTKGSNSQENLFIHRIIYTVVAGVYSYLGSFLFKSDATKEIEFSFIDLLKVKINILNLLIDKKPSPERNRAFDRIMINIYKHREKINFQKKNTTDDKVLHFLTTDMIIVEKLMAIYTYSMDHNIKEEDMEILKLLRRLMKYFYFYREEGNIKNKSKFYDTVFEVQQITSRKKNEYTRLLIITYNYFIKVVREGSVHKSEKSELKKLLKERMKLKK